MSSNHVVKYLCNHDNNKNGISTCLAIFILNSHYEFYIQFQSIQIKLLYLTFLPQN